MLSVMLPVPVPNSDTVSVTPGTTGPNVAVSVWLLFTVTLHGPVPVQVLQPLKVVLALGVAVNVTTVPLR